MSRVRPGGLFTSPRPSTDHVVHRALNLHPLPHELAKRLVPNKRGLQAGDWQQGEREQQREDDRAARLVHLAVPKVREVSEPQQRVPQQHDERLGEDRSPVRFAVYAWSRHEPVEDVLHVAVTDHHPRLDEQRRDGDAAEDRHDEGSRRVLLRVEALVVGEDGVAPDPDERRRDPGQAPVHAQLPELLGKGQPTAAREGLGAHREVVNRSDGHRERSRDRHATRVVTELVPLLDAAGLRSVVEARDAHEREDDPTAAGRADGQRLVPRGEHLPPVGHHVRVPAGPRSVAHPRLVEVTVDPPAPVQPRVPHPKQIRRLRAEPPRRDDHAQREHPHGPRVQKRNRQLRVQVKQHQVHEQLHALVQMGFSVKPIQDNHAGVHQDVAALGGYVLRLPKQKRTHVVIPLGGHGEYVERPAALYQR
mmetsp:Transcript_7744/g.35153  ORF Transcript_7744/g.35153 Transcript_7744/m.35153 type:complete len:420 (+) Transcript_7744:65-1324(+)